MTTEINITNSGIYSCLYVETDEIFTQDEAFNLLKDMYKKKTGDEIVINDTFGYDKLQVNGTIYYIKMGLRNGK